MSTPCLPRTDLTLDDARGKLAGWHFAQESLTKTEREILYVAEALLRQLDADANRYANRENYNTTDVPT